MPTLTAGVSINHVSSVSVSLLAGTLLSLVGYERLAWAAAAAIVLSVPFALAIRIDEPGSGITECTEEDGGTEGATL
jgi:hypothetical protein